MEATYRVPSTGGIKLGALSPADTGEFSKGDSADDRLRDDTKALADLQELIYVAGTHGILIVLQGMDASGKDGTIRHVLSELDPIGCRVYAFKQPSKEELAHDFLWRVHRQVPEKGEIVIFNRSHYEDVLVVRVQNIAPEPVWRPRYQIINEFERGLAASGTVILKFFLHISKDEQVERLRERIAEPDKRWKVNPGDWLDRQKWSEFQAAYEDVLNQTSTDHAPWYVVPSDKKWYRNLVIGSIIRQRLEALAPEWRKTRLAVGQKNVEALEEARKTGKITER